MEQKKDKILIVEDNPKLADLIIRKLNKDGYDVYKANNGKAALEKIEIILPDLIILDVLMPEMNGYEVKEELSRNELTCNIPVIFLTGKDALDDKVKGLSLGADDYMTKPFKNEELLARVQAILRRKKYYEYLAMHDGLTGLYNLIYFEQQFSLFFNMAERYGNLFSLVMIDVNRFKFINDTYGHKIGDKVLKIVAEVMVGSLRKSDLISRYGGDEFTLILPQTDGIKTTELAQRLAATVSSTLIEINKKESINISISFGVVEYSKDFKNKDEMFQVADKNMYDYKKKYSESQSERTDQL